MKEKRLVITGMGACTPIGIGVQQYWKNLINGVCGIDRITRFDASSLPVQIAAEVNDFRPSAYLPKTLARTMDLFMQYAYVAAEEALLDSGFSVEPEADRVGIVMGTAMDGIAAVARTQERVSAKGSPACEPPFRTDDSSAISLSAADCNCAWNPRPEFYAQYSLFRRRRCDYDGSHADPFGGS